jgi:DNA adenine methylase
MAVPTTHRQFGSKVRVAAQLLALVPADVRVWVEGFAGTAAMTLAKAPHPAEHINDFNRDVVGLYSVLRDDAQRERLCRLLSLTPYAEAEFRACLEALYGGAAPVDDPVERARQWLVCSWQAIGGKQLLKASWRLDLCRSWLIPVWQSVPARLQEVAVRLRGAHIHCKHILELVDLFADKPEVLLFLDPPYPRHTLATHETLYAVDMSDDEHRALAERLRTVRCRVLLTMGLDTVYQRVLADWHVVPFSVRGMRNAVKTEAALLNYTPPARTLFCEAAE